MGHELVLYGKGKGKGIDDPQAKRLARRTIDYNSDVVRWLEDALVRRVPAKQLQTHYSYTKELMPPFATPQSPYDSICPRFVHASTNKNRAPVNVVHWFPHGRRLVSGTQTGEMTVWNGFLFHFENIMQAHNAAVRAMQWTPEETVLVSGDQLGVIKFWDQYLYNFQTFQGHKESICDITVAPTGLKFCSCADDSHAKVWDLRTGEEERAFTGHGWDVKCCNWHPTKGLVATGSKDSQIKLWDPRASEAITTIFCHKNTVTRVAWSPNGQWLASGSRDQLVMLMDIRTMSVRKVFKAHHKEVTSLCWHPETDSLLASGGYDANLHFWDTHGASEPMESVIGAHEGPIWSLSWHPLGHLLVSGSHDYSTRFWSRARPGDTTWADLLPKKIGAIAIEEAAEKVPSAVGFVGSVYEAGIFARPSPPPPPPKTEEEVAAQTKVKALENLDIPKEPSKPVAGLTMGSQGVLDTSDFDAEDMEPGQVCEEKPVAVELATTKPAVPEPAVASAPEKSAVDDVEIATAKAQAAAEPKDAALSMDAARVDVVAAGGVPAGEATATSPPSSASPTDAALAATAPSGVMDTAPATTVPMCATLTDGKPSEMAASKGASVGEQSAVGPTTTEPAAVDEPIATETPTGAGEASSAEEEPVAWPSPSDPVAEEQPTPVEEPATAAEAIIVESVAAAAADEPGMEAMAVEPGAEVVAATLAATPEGGELPAAKRRKIDEACILQGEVAAPGVDDRLEADPAPPVDQATEVEKVPEADAAPKADVALSSLPDQI